MGQQFVSILLGLMLLLSSLTACAPAHAQFANTDFRLSQLETEVSNLRSQVNRLASNLDRQPPTPLPPMPEAPSPLEPAPIASTDARFTRLATLVIELRQEVTELQTRVRALESQRSLS